MHVVHLFEGVGDGAGEEKEGEVGKLSFTIA